MNLTTDHNFHPELRAAVPLTADCTNLGLNLYETKHVVKMFNWERHWGVRRICISSYYVIVGLSV